MAVAAVGGQPVAGGGAAALEASRGVDAAVRADVAPGGQGAFINVCEDKATSASAAASRDTGAQS